MAIGYDGGSYTGNLDEISLALGVEPDIEGVTSRLGTPVDPLGHLQDATILGGMPFNDTLLAQLARTDPELVRDIMRSRTYMSGEGLLGQGQMGDPLLQTVSMMDDAVGGGDSTINFGQKMGETYDDFLARIISDAEESVKKDYEEDSKTNIFTGEIPVSDTLVKDTQEKLEKVYDKDFTLDAIEDRIQTGTNSALQSLVQDSEAVYEKMVDRPPKNVYEALAPVRDRPEAMPLATPVGTTDIFDVDVGDDILSGTQSFEVKTPPGTTDIFDTETGEWTALRPHTSRKSAEDELQKLISLEEETTVLDEEEDESVFQKVIAETLGIPVDTINAVISSILRAAGAPQHIIEKPVGGRAWLAENKGMTLDGLVAQIAEMLTPTTPSGVVAPTPDYSWPVIPTVQDTQANVMDEGFLSGLDMTADESHALTRELNRQRIGGREPYPHEIEARKQGALLNPLSRYAQTGQNLERLEEESNLTNQSHQQQSGFLEGLSQAMRNVLNDDPELMAQYMAARNDIIAQLNKTGYKEHEEFYPGSQAAATQAGFWGPMALGWNDSYNDYKDAQRELMGLQSGQRFMSDDWINNLGWMTPAQINQVTGYGES